MTKIKDLMVKKVITVQARTSVYEAVKLVNEKKIGSLVIIRNGETVGILTERDLLERVLEKCKNPSNFPIGDNHGNSPYTSS